MYKPKHKLHCQNNLGQENKFTLWNIFYYLKIKTVLYKFAFFLSELDFVKTTLMTLSLTHSSLSLMLYLSYHIYSRTRHNRLGQKMIWQDKPTCCEYSFNPLSQCYWLNLARHCCLLVRDTEGHQQEAHEWCLVVCERSFDFCELWET